MKVLDLYAGLDGWGAAFRDRGHSVVSLDLDPRFGSNVVADAMNIHALNGFDVILASPPCECFSVMTVTKNWRKDVLRFEPKTDRAAAALALMEHTFALIDAAKPRYYVVENPRGMMRKLAPRLPNFTVWYCRLGFPYAKPTDLWTNLTGFSGMTCRPGGEDHQYAGGGPNASTGGNAALEGKEIAQPRRRPDGRWDTRYIRDQITDGKRVVGWRVDTDGGLRHRTQFELTGGTRKAARALIPYGLSLAVAIACETDGIVRQPTPEVPTSHDAYGYVA